MYYLLVMVLLSLLMLASYEWHAWDGRRMSRPMTPDYGPVEEWATDLEWDLLASPEVNVGPPIGVVLARVDARRAVARRTYTWAHAAVRPTLASMVL